MTSPGSGSYRKVEADVAVHKTLAEDIDTNKETINMCVR